MVNELKAIVVMNNLLEASGSITRDQCMSVEHFDYHFAHKRDEKGHTYKASEPAMLNFSVRLNSVEQAKPFYKQLTVIEYGPLSFLFNAAFSDTRHLTDYDDAMVVDGFIVDVQEDFSSTALTAQSEEQIILRARMLVRSVTYIGRNENKKLCFIQ